MLNLTAVASVKLAPLIVTLVPVGPLVGVKLVIRGATVKSPALVPVPAGFVTVILPVVALAGTVAVILMSELKVKAAEVPLSLTDVVPVKWVPLIVTLIPTAPFRGEKLVIVGPRYTVKLVALVAVPADVVTTIGPVVASAGTVAVILMAELTVKVVAEMPLKLTDVAPVKLAPLIVTLAPAGPLVGEKLVIRGATTKFAALVAVPPAVVTLMGPVVALAGTVAVIWVLEFTVNVAAVPLNLTDVTPKKPEPVIVTGMPTAPLAGRKPVMSALSVNVPTLVAVPAGAVTAIFPVVAAAGTVALI